MKYINTKTGAIIETESILRGTWEEYDPSMGSNKNVEIKKEKDVETKKEDVIDKKQSINTDDFDSVTIADIKKELDAFGISYDTKAKKKDLWKLMTESR